MAEATVELSVPAAIYERAEAVASDCGRSTESLIVDGLSLLFAEMNIMELEPEALEDFADERLLAVVYQRLAFPHNKRMRELMQLGQAGRASEDEIVEMDNLVAKFDHLVLLRSEALLQLKKRGHNIEKLLKLGA